MTAVMEEATYRKLRVWVFDNHEHHDMWADAVNDDDYHCSDGDSPYVNSLRLEELLISLVPEDFNDRFVANNYKE